jgi:hypothetical protein
MSAASSSACSFIACTRSRRAIAFGNTSSKNSRVSVRHSLVSKTSPARRIRLRNAG